VKRLFPLVVAAALVSTLAACGGGGGSKNTTTTGSASGVPNPIVFCVDTTYPPAESIVNGKAAGYDIDIANAVAKQLGSTAQIKTTGFTVIIGALKAKKCNAIISSMTITPERSKVISAGGKQDPAEAGEAADHHQELSGRHERGPGDHPRPCLGVLRRRAAGPVLHPHDARAVRDRRQAARDRARGHRVPEGRPARPEDQERRPGAVSERQDEDDPREVAGEPVRAEAVGTAAGCTC
jgi:hypothetical protein